MASRRPPKKAKSFPEIPYVNPIVQTERVGQKGMLPIQVKFRLTEFYDATTNTLRFKDANGDDFFILDLNTGEVTIRNLSLIGNTNSTIILTNDNGDENIIIRIDPGGFGEIIANDFVFKTNENNNFSENFGIVANLADNVGTHAFRVRNSDGTELYAIRSDGILKMSHPSFIEYLGTIADPGGSPTPHAARTYVRDSGLGKDQFCVEFDTGAAQVMATEP